MGVTDSSFIKACYGRNDGAIPVWIMRQAGRYLPEYLEVREKVSFQELCHSPELIAEVVHQPLRRFNLDAAILFSDILTILEPMGIKVDFPDSGPVLDNPIDSPDDIERLKDFNIEKHLSFVLDGIREIKKILPDIPLIGFVGSPFTLACYMIEGQGSKTFNKCKKFLHEYPEATEKLFEYLSDIMSQYLAAQIKAGAEAVQIFESWGGILSYDSFDRWSVKPCSKIFDKLSSYKAPRIYFINNVAPYLDLIRDVPCEVIGVDYRTNLQQAMKALPNHALQGNIDPTILFGSREMVTEKTKSMLDSIDHFNRYIFNLGHGILPETPIESVAAMVDTVHSTGRKMEDKCPAINISVDLLRKYDRPGPRYTSYPTVPVWSEEVNGDYYRQALQSAGQREDDPLAIYIHIPFCRRRCYYCGCNTFVSSKPSNADDYLDILIHEIEQTKRLLNKRDNVSQIHFGGGTPTFLNPAGLKRILDALDSNFTYTKGCEKSIEIDPRVTTVEQLEYLARRGFNRASIGVQDFDPDVQEASGRVQSQEKVIEILDNCRRLNFKGVNFDLIYGLPRQTIKSFRETIKKAIELKPDRLAVYSFAYLPRLKAHQKLINPELLPSTEEKYQIFAAAIEMFTAAGYRQIGMDHFALPTDELSIAQAGGRLHRNFMGYTVQTSEEMLGFGMSSIGYIEDSFVQNIPKLDSYKKAVEENGLAVFKGKKLSQDDLIRRYVITMLMCNFILKFDRLRKIYDINYFKYFADEHKALKPFFEDNFLEETPESLKITEMGRTFVRNIAMTYDSYLPKGDSDKKTNFSRTI